MYIEISRTLLLTTCRWYLLRPQFASKPKPKFHSRTSTDASADLGVRWYCTTIFCCSNNKFTPPTLSVASHIKRYYQNIMKFNLKNQLECWYNGYCRFYFLLFVVYLFDFVCVCIHFLNVFSIQSYFVVDLFKQVRNLSFGSIFILTHFCLASHKRGIGKHCLIRVYSVYIKYRNFYKTW